MYDIVYKLPKEIPVSPDIKKNALAYLRVMVSGTAFYYPVTKEVKKMLKMKFIKGKLIIDYNLECGLEKFMRDGTNMMYWYLKEIIKHEVYEKLDENIMNGLSKMYEQQLSKAIADGVNQVEQKLLLPSKEK